MNGIDFIKTMDNKYYWQVQESFWFKCIRTDCTIKSSRDVVDLNADFLIRTVIIKVLGRAGSSFSSFVLTIIM